MTGGELIPWLGGTGGSAAVMVVMIRWLKARRRLRVTVDVDDVRFDLQVTRAPDA
jgi:hypothetical protein